MAYAGRRAYTRRRTYGRRLPLRRMTMRRYPMRRRTTRSRFQDLDTRVARFMNVFDVDYNIDQGVSVQGEEYTALSLMYGYTSASGTPVALTSLGSGSGDRYHIAAMYDSARLLRLSVKVTPRVLPGLAGNHVLSFLSCWDRYGRDFPTDSAAYVAAVTGDFSLKQTNWSSGGSARSSYHSIYASGLGDKANFLKIQHNADGTVQFVDDGDGDDFLPDFHTVLDLGMIQPVATVVRLRFEVSYSMLFRGRHGTTTYVGISPAAPAMAQNTDAPVLVNTGGASSPSPLLGPFPSPDTLTANDRFYVVDKNQVTYVEHLLLPRADYTGPPDVSLTGTYAFPLHSLYVDHCYLWGCLADGTPIPVRVGFDTAPFYHDPAAVLADPLEVLEVVFSSLEAFNPTAYVDFGRLDIEYVPGQVVVAQTAGVDVDTLHWELV